MTDYSAYLLRLTVIWAVAIAYYILALRRATPRGQRIYLLLATAAGLIVPALPTLTEPAALPVIQPIQEALSLSVAPVDSESAEHSAKISLLPIIYLMGIFLSGALTLVRWYGRWRWNATGDRSVHEGYPLTTHPDIPSPFTVYGRIYLPAGLVGTALGKTALLHETAHLRQRHHYDALCIEILCTLLWFHPGAWVLRKLLSTVHEYEADASVVQSIPTTEYGLQLLRASLAPSYALGLFSSPLKNRIAMLTHAPTRNPRLTLALLPLLLLGMLTFTCSDVVAQDAPLKAEAVSAAGVPHLVGLPDDATDKEAMHAFLKTVYSEIKYPKVARNSGTEGLVYLTMTVSPDGKSRQFEVTDRGTSPSFGGDNVVIVGYGDEAAEDDKNRDTKPLIDEVTRIVFHLNKLGGFKYEDSGYEGVPITYGIGFRFKLEEKTGE